MKDFKVGDKFGFELQVTDEIYNSFLKIFNDKNPLHTDANFAQSKGFHDRVMHGNILNGFISYFIGECLPVKNVIIHSQEIQFKLPVYLNARLRFEASVHDIFDSVN